MSISIRATLRIRHAGLSELCLLPKLLLPVERSNLGGVDLLLSINTLEFEVYGS